MRHVAQPTLLGPAIVSACAEHTPPATVQQNLMGQCNKEGGERKGEERKQFMSACLRKK